MIFSIVNRPPWASFDWRTGELHGTPSSDDQGSFADIRIGVSDGRRWWRRETVYLSAFSITVTAAENTPEPANEPPVISGNPPAEVVQGSTYDFAPDATDPDGDVLTFSVSNKPSWATFNTSSGRLSGTPGSADLGDYPDISIAADDGADTASLAPFSIAVVGSATGTATLSWRAPTSRTDGSSLDNLAGYRILWGTSEGNYPNSVEIHNPGITSYVIDNLAPAVYYFVVVAIDANELESEYSNEAQKTVGSM
ncbi:MAG: hypothetical protein JXB36_06030 [Gammaproteobacteria bacterium]|nr:hypothetical protein [Gammaproteobacteria bacterium]